MSETIRWISFMAFSVCLVALCVGGFMWATHSWPFDKFAGEWEQYMEQKHGGKWRF